MHLQLPCQPLSIAPYLKQRISIGISLWPALWIVLGFTALLCGLSCLTLQSAWPEGSFPQPPEPVAQNTTSDEFSAEELTENTQSLPTEPLPKAKPALIVQWQYKPDAHQYLEHQLGHYQQQYEHFPSNPETNQFAREADQKATDRRPLSHWGLRSETHPWVIHPYISITNPTNTPWLDAKITTIIDIHWGELRVDSHLFLTDLTHLQQSAQWFEYKRTTHPVPVLSPDDTQLIQLPPLELLPLITPKHQNNTQALSDQWPESIRIRVWLSPTQDHLPSEQHTKGSTLTLYPDYFLTPFHPLRGSI